MLPPKVCKTQPFAIYEQNSFKSNKESHWLQVSAPKLLEYYSKILISKMSTSFIRLASYLIQSYLLKR